MDFNSFWLRQTGNNETNGRDELRWDGQKGNTTHGVMGMALFLQYFPGSDRKGTLMSRDFFPFIDDDGDGTRKIRGGTSSVYDVDD